MSLPESLMILAALPELPPGAVATRLSEACFHLPFGLVLAALLVELFSGGRKSLDLDKATVLLLFSAGILAFVNAFLAFSQNASGNSQAAIQASGMHAILGTVCVAAGLLKQQWYLKKLVDMAKSRVKRGRTRSSGSLIPTFYFIVLLGAILGVTGMSIYRPGPLIETPVVPAEQTATLADETEPGTEPEESLAKETTPLPIPSKTPEPSVVESMPAQATEPLPMPDVAETEQTEALPPAEESELATSESNEAAQPEATMVTPAESQPATTIAPTVVNPAAVQAFNQRVVPILRKNCYSCHGAEKKKGGLQLNTPALIRKGGDSGPVITPGAPNKSYLYTSTILPDGDADLMPAKGKRLSKSETETLRKWIEAGAPMGDGNDVGPVVASNQTSEKSGPDSLGLPAALAQHLADSPIQIKAIPGSNLLEIDCSFIRNYEDVTLDLSIFTPIANRIALLDLTSTQVKDDDLIHLTKMGSLKQLMLNRTSIGDAALKSVGQLKSLESLNLYGTEVTDAGLPQLTGLTNLKKLYLWNSKATKKGADALRAKLGDQVTINIGG